MDTVVVGQERALGALRQAAARPGHAYLLVGPRGSGIEDAAREFAAMLIGVADDERGSRLVMRSVHPDVVEFEPESTVISVVKAAAWKPSMMLAGKGQGCEEW